MKNIGAVLFVFFCSCTPYFASANNDLGHHDIYIIFEPLVARSGHYEVLEKIEFNTNVISPETDQRISACVIYLQQVQMLPGQGIPLDESGQQMILLDDELTWLPAADLIDLAISGTECVVSFVGS